MIEAIFLIEESDSLLPALFSMLGALVVAFLFLGGQ